MLCSTLLCSALNIAHMHVDVFPDKRNVEMNWMECKLGYDIQSTCSTNI